MKRYIKGSLYFLLAFVCLFAGTVFASGTGSTAGLGGIAEQVTKSFFSIGKLMIAVSYIAGIGFAIGGIFKFKQHKDNPTQIPLGTPLALLVIGIALVFLPSFFGPAGETLFGGGANTQTPGGFEGGGAEKLPGAKT